MIVNICDISLNIENYNQIIDLYNNFNNYYRLIDKNILTFEKFENIIKNIPHNHNILLYIDNSDNIIGGITLIIEQKIIHDGKCVGHIEDFVVLESHRKKGIGDLLMQRVKIMCKKSNCYKIILDCHDFMEDYYNKKRFKKKGKYMALYF